MSKINSDASGVARVQAQFSLKKPCAECPFAKDEAIQLRSGRRESIMQDLASQRAGTFHCHKTLDADKQDRKHCAGAMSLSMKLGFQPQTLKIAHRLGFIAADHYTEAGDLTMAPESLDQLKMDSGYESNS